MMVEKEGQQIFKHYNCETDECEIAIRITKGKRIGLSFAVDDEITNYTYYNIMKTDYGYAISFSKPVYKAKLGRKKDSVIITAVIEKGFYIITFDKERKIIHLHKIGG